MMIATRAAFAAMEVEVEVALANAVAPPPKNQIPAAKNSLLFSSPHFISLHFISSHLISSTGGS